MPYPGGPSQLCVEPHIGEGTCSTGRHAAAVVDPDRGFHGVHGVRVVNGSVMPVMVRGHRVPPAAAYLILRARGGDTAAGSASPGHRRALMHSCRTALVTRRANVPPDARLSRSVALELENAARTALGHQGELQRQPILKGRTDDLQSHGKPG